MKIILKSILKLLINFIPSGLVFPILKGPLKGQKWIVGAADGSSKGMSIVINQSEPEQVDYALKFVNKESICFDIGANVGFYSLLFAKNSKQVFSFEPLPRNLKHLIRLTEINNLNNVNIIPCGISDSSKIGYFSKGRSHSLGKLDTKGDILVLINSCDEFIASTKIIPDLLKIDVEGAELEVLKGANNLLTQSHPTILLSTHSDKLRTDCLAFLNKSGYEKIVPLNKLEIDHATEFGVEFKKN